MFNHVVFEPFLMKDASPRFCRRETAVGRCLDENCTEDHARGYVNTIKYFKALEEEQAIYEAESEDLFIDGSREPVDPQDHIMAKIDEEFEGSDDDGKDPVIADADEFFHDWNVATGAYEKLAAERRERKAQKQKKQ